MPLIEGVSVSVALIALAGVYGNVTLAGVYKVVGVARCDTESLGPRVAYCFDGNVADNGESAFGSNPSPLLESSPSNPSPIGCCCRCWCAFSSGGGVGVRGGSGIGMLEAIAAT